MFLFFHDSTCRMCTFPSSTNNFAHAQTLSRMSSLSGRMNIARVNIECFTWCKRIKQRRISFVLGYLRMILWIISTAISIKHRIFWQPYEINGFRVLKLRESIHSGDMILDIILWKERLTQGKSTIPPPNVNKRNNHIPPYLTKPNKKPGHMTL